MTTLLFIVIFGFFTWRGYRKGLVGAVTPIICFIVAYPTSIFFTKPTAHVLRAFTGIDGVLVLMLAGSGLFLAVSLALTLAIKALARATPYNNLTDAGSKMGGLACGAIVGTIFGLIAAYTLELMLIPSHMQASTAMTSEGDIGDDYSNYSNSDSQALAASDKFLDKDRFTRSESLVDKAAKQLVSTAAATAVGILSRDQDAGLLTKTLTQNPQATLAHMRNISNNDGLKTLLSDPEFQAELNRGKLDTLLQNKRFQTLLNNPDMQAMLAADNPADERAAAEKMLQAWQKVASLKSDPRVLEIMRDPEFQAQLNSTNKLPLLLNPKLRQLSELIFDTEKPQVKAAPSAPIAPATAVSNTATNGHYKVEDITQGTGAAVQQLNPETAPASPPETKIYRWTDAEGKVHYTDKPIKN